MFPAASVASGSQVILHELLPLPPILVALSALALGLFGAQKFEDFSVSKRSSERDNTMIILESME